MLIMWLWIYIFLKKTHIKSTHLLRKASWKFRIFKSRILQREDSHEYLYPQAFLWYFFLNLKKRKFLSFYCRTSLCVLIDLVQQGVLLSYNLTRLILAHAGNKIIVVQSKSCLSFHFYLIPLLVFIRDSTCSSFWFVWYL